MSFIMALVLASAQLTPAMPAASYRARAEARSQRARVRGGKRNARYTAAANVQALAAICDAAGRNGDPAAYLGDLGAAFGMSRSKQAALQKACALYLAERPAPQPAIKMFR